MPSQPHLFGLSSPGVEPAPKRASAAQASGQEFGRVLQASTQAFSQTAKTRSPLDSSQSNTARQSTAALARERAADGNQQATRTPTQNSDRNQREPSAASNREPSAASNREPSAASNQEPSATKEKETSATKEKETSANKNKEPSTDTRKASNSDTAGAAGQESLKKERAAEGEDGEQKLTVSGLAEQGTQASLLSAEAQELLGQLQSVSGEKAGLDLEQSLEALSSEDLKALKAQVEQLLQRLVNQLESGQLSQEQKEALAELMEALQSGDSDAKIAQSLEAIPAALLLDTKEGQARDASLKDVLGKAGQDYLAKLAERLNSASESGSAKRSLEVELAGKLREEKLEADAVLAKKTDSSALKEKFSELLQLGQTTNKASARSTDLGQSSSNTNALASLDTASGRQLQPAERGFVVQTEVKAPVGQQPQWSQAVGQRVLWMAAQNLSSAELQLNPPELGPMQVKVSMQNDQISVNFTSAQSVVREALDQGAARLREMFESEGLDLVNVDVSEQSEQQLAEEQQGRSGSGRGRANGEEQNEPQEAHIWVSERLVDHYA